MKTPRWMVNDEQLAEIRRNYRSLGPGELRHIILALLAEVDRLRVERDVSVEMSHYLRSMAFRRGWSADTDEVYRRMAAKHPAWLGELER